MVGEPCSSSEKNEVESLAHSTPLCQVQQCCPTVNIFFGDSYFLLTEILSCNKCLFMLEFVRLLFETTNLAPGNGEVLSMMDTNIGSWELLLGSNVAVC
jgi:hypothetical protein